jgi:putative transposase
VSRKYRFSDKDRLHFVTYATVGWVDFFTRREYRTIITESPSHCINAKGLDIYAWVIMTNHVHLIISSRDKKLEDIMRDHKRHTSEKLRTAIEEDVAESRREWIMALFSKAGSENSNNRVFQLWQQHNRPIELWSKEVILQKLAYIHTNPAKAGFVEQPEDWIWSSAKAHARQGSRIEELLLIEW